MTLLELTHLADIGTKLLRAMGARQVIAAVLPDGLGVSVYDEVRGAGTVLVARDETVLFVVSAVPMPEALTLFRAGQRTPLDGWLSGPTLP